jgi:hypothetical protein
VCTQQNKTNQMNKHYIRQNITLFAIGIFVFIFAVVQFCKPSCFYNKNGSIREFGIGYKNKTILPIWLFTILLGILSYLAVLYYISNTRVVW